MMQKPDMIDRLASAYDSMVGIFAYTVSMMSKSLPKSDSFCKSATQLVPVANQLLATTRQYDKDDNFSSDETIELLHSLCVSDTPTFDAIQDLGLLPLVQKIHLYHDLIRNIK